MDDRDRAAGRRRMDGGLTVAWRRMGGGRRRMDSGLTGMDGGLTARGRQRTGVPAV